MTTFSPYCVGSVDTRMSTLRWPNRDHEAAILRGAALSDIHVGENLDAGHERVLDASGNTFQFAQDSIHADSHNGCRGLRLNVDVAGLLVHGLLYDFRHQADRRSFLLIEFRLNFLNRFAIGLAGTGRNELHLCAGFQSGLIGRLASQARCSRSGHNSAQSRIEFRREIQTAGRCPCRK